MAALAFLIPLALYFLFPSCLWNFDGVACASAIELGQPLHFFHSNHLIYAFLGFLFFKTVHFFFPSIRAIFCLQAFTSLLSGFSCLGIYQLLSKRLLSNALALGVTLLLSVCAVYWVWSVEAQVYALGLLGVTWGSYFLFTRASTLSTYKIVALWQAFAVLGHVMHLLWVVPALFWIFHQERLSGRKGYGAASLYLVWLMVPVALAYTVVISLVVWPALKIHPGSFLIWLKGSAGLASAYAWKWHARGWTAPWVWMKTTGCFFWGSLWPYPGATISPLSWTSTAVSVLGILSLLISATRSRERFVLKFCALWIAAYALLFWTWEPATECYRLSEAVPFALLLGLGLQRWRPVFRKWIFPLIIVSTGWATFATRIFPMHDPQRNAAFVQVKALARLSAPDSVYLTAGGTPWIYLLYFIGRPAWNAFAPGTRPLIENLNNPMRRPVPFYIETSLFTHPSIAPFLSHVKTKPVANDLPWVRIQ